MKQVKGVACACALLMGAFSAQGQFTMTSPTSEGVLPSGVSVIGGIVYDIVGVNGTRVVAQTPASQLFRGNFNSGSPTAYRGNPGTIGIQSGFTPAVVGALGGGIAEMSIRLTVQDGDTASFNFDWFDNDLLVNGVNFGDFSDVPTVQTNSIGTQTSGVQNGFANGRLNTGFFYSNNSTMLSSIYTTMSSTQQLRVQLLDEDPYENYFDFRQGLSSGLIDIGTGPVVTPQGPAVPEPSLIGLLGFGALMGVIGYRRRRRKTLAA